MGAGFHCGSCSRTPQAVIKIYSACTLPSLSVFYYIHPAGNSGYGLESHPSLLSCAVQTLDLWKFTDFATQNIFLLLSSFYKSAELPPAFPSQLPYIPCRFPAAGLAVSQLLSGLPRGQFDGIQCLYENLGIVLN